MGLRGAGVNAKFVHNRRKTKAPLRNAFSTLHPTILTLTEERFFNYWTKWEAVPAPCRYFTYQHERLPQCEVGAKVRYRGMVPIPIDSIQSVIINVSSRYGIRRKPESRMRN